MCLRCMSALMVAQMEEGRERQVNHTLLSPVRGAPDQKMVAPGTERGPGGGDGRRPGKTPDWWIQDPRSTPDFSQRSHAQS